MLSVRRAQPQDLERIIKIYEYAQDFMIRSGNPSQWGHFYPDEELIRNDINQKICRVICDGEEICGVFALLEGAEPTYETIEGGSWLNDEPYVTIHRLAGGGRVHGLFSCAVSYCRGLSVNIRVDTHADNLIMQKLIEREGFVKCGTVYVRDGSPRIAYQWTAL